MIDMDTIYCCVKNARCFRTEFLFTMLEWDWFFFVPTRPEMRRLYEPNADPIAVLEDARKLLSAASLKFYPNPGKLVAWGVNEIPHREVAETREKLMSEMNKFEPPTHSYIGDQGYGKKKAQWKQEQRRFRK